MFFLFIGLSLISSPGFCISIEKTANTSPLATREPHQFLQTHLNFSEKDLVKMEDGKVVVKLFDEGDIENEVGVFGVVRVDTPKHVLLEQFRDIETFTESDVVKQIGKFSNPPRLEDLQPLTVGKNDQQDLKKCKPGDCKLKLNAAMMERFRSEIDWESPEHSEQVNALTRQMLFGYVTDYLQRGDAALGEYHDKDEPLQVAEAFQGIMDNSSFLAKYVPEFFTYIKNFPHGDLPGAEHFLYWSKEGVGLKPVIYLFHVFMYNRERSDRDNDVFIVTKQIYANHYFEGYLSFTAFVGDDGGDDPAASYLMYLNRSRFDQLGGPLKGFILRVAKNRVRSGMKQYFGEVKDRLEAYAVKNRVVTQ
ncbi:hypothetical protein CSA56_01760 [candidate division KSB3 bacterium]|uniref:Uncharacterized protein n=1 Tax=candidate division KSB3 bacterium TaxID=2044937 RepID=A0A2G6KK27_9BACT|nr:MAG: hypothetical protein CSA56_01760 [candidate division KSB3 bacterium]